MNQTRSLDASGVLYVVATPIGNLGDLSTRAIETLRTVDHVAAEDTRRSKQLLSHLGIQTHCFSLHEHNERQRIAQILQYLQNGESVALVSDAGTPLISDPGFPLVRELREQGFQVIPIPGPCALITALSAAGIASDRFYFEGFLPAKSGARKNRLQALVGLDATLVLYESSHRIIGSLTDMAEVMGEQRFCVVARELTKTFETFMQGELRQVIRVIQADTNQQKGEFVVMLAAEQRQASKLAPEVIALAERLLGHLPAKTVAKLCAEHYGVKKNEVYQYLLNEKDK